MNRIFEPETDFNSLEVFIVIFVLLLFRHIVFEFTVHTCMPNAGHHALVACMALL